MRQIIIDIYKVHELERAQKQRAYIDFLDFTDETQDNTIHHTLDEFIEVSNVNEWEYRGDGSFYQ